MKERLDGLVRIFHERNIVEKLIEAKSDEERIAIYKEEKKAVLEKLHQFYEDAEYDIRVSNIIKAENCYEILPEHALEICFICIMAGIDDMDMFEESEMLPIALRKIEADELSRVAENIAHFISAEEDDEASLFTTCKEEELLIRFFN